MIILAIVFALLGAGANALATVMQKLSSSEPAPNELFSKKFIKTMVTHRLWLGGVAFDFLGFLLQAAALYIGSLVLVEPILTIDLVILFLVAHYRFKAKAGPGGWAGAVLVCAGLGTFLTALDPSGGHKAFSGWQFGMAVSFVAVVVLVSAVVMRKITSDKTRVVAGALATGLNFSLTAILTKMAMSDLSGGVGAMLFGWPFWAMAVSAATALVIMQSTYVSGSLKLSQPIITIVGPVCSAAFGVFLFDTQVRAGWPYLLIESAGALMAMAGIILLAGSKSVSGFQGNEIL